MTDEQRALADAIIAAVVEKVLAEVRPQIQELIDIAKRIMDSADRTVTGMVDRIDSHGIAQQVCEVLERQIGDIVDRRVEKHLDRMCETYLSTRSAVTTIIARKRGT